MKGRPELGLGKRGEAGCEEVDVGVAKSKELGYNLECKTNLDVAVVLGLR